MSKESVSTHPHANSLSMRPQNNGQKTKSIPLRQVKAVQIFGKFKEYD